VQAVKTLADRNSVFMRNEVELCRLSNMTSITKLELDQKEKAIQDLKQKDPKAADPLQKASEPLQQQIS
jgi:hypothetical protein